MPSNRVCRSGSVPSSTQVWASLGIGRQHLAGLPSQLGQLVAQQQSARLWPVEERKRRGRGTSRLHLAGVIVEQGDGGAALQVGEVESALLQVRQQLLGQALPDEGLGRAGRPEIAVDYQRQAFPVKRLAQ